MILATSLPTLGTVLGLALQAPPTPQRAPDSLVSFDGRRVGVERTTLARSDVVGPDTVALDIAYLRIPAATPRPGSPIVFLMGGPGFDHGVRLPTALDSLLDRLSALAARDSVARPLAPDLRAAITDRLRDLWPAPRFMTVEQALQPPRRPGAN